MKKIMRIIFGSIMGVVFLVFGISTYINNIDEAKDAIGVEAMITKIEKYSTTNNYKNEQMYKYRVYVDYNFNNVEYKNKEINLNSNLYKTGDYIKVKINVNQPDIPIYIEQSKLAIIFIIIGIILILFNIVINIFIF